MGPDLRPVDPGRGGGAVTRRSGPGYGELLRSALAGSGLSLFEVARRAGVQRSALARFVSGERGITFETFERVGPVVGVRLIVKPARPAKGGGRGGDAGAGE